MFARFDDRDIGTFPDTVIRVKSPPQAPDWVLVIDDDAKGFAPPGLKP